MTIIGWDLDLDSQLVAIARRNALKAFYGFATTSLEIRVPVKTVQAWASWAERYGEICVYMRPFRRVLYSQFIGRRHNVSIVIEEKAKRVARLYAALLAMTLQHEPCFTRSLTSFAVQAPTLTIMFDGSLSGSGIIWYTTMWSTKQNRYVEQVALGGMAVDLRVLEFGSDPSFQNCAEFISATLGLVGAIFMGWDISSVRFVGDSVTALTWTEGGRFRSDNVMNAATVLSMVCATKVYNVSESVQISSEENWACDRLSRKEPGENWTTLVKGLGSSDTRLMALKEVVLPNLDEILTLCDPRESWVDDESFGTFWRRVYDCVLRM